MICTIEDDFVRDRFESETRWVAVLSDGRKVFQDDNRPDVFPASAWLRLKEYCEKTGNKIVKMHIQFRTHVVSLPDDAPGYYFSKGVAGIAFSEASDGTWGQFIVGTLLENGSLQRITYRVPELIIEKNEVVPPERIIEKKMDRFLIRN